MTYFFKFQCCQVWTEDGWKDDQIIRSGLYAMFSTAFGKPRRGRVSFDDVLRNERRIVDADSLPIEGKIYDNAWLQARITCYDWALRQGYLPEYPAPLPKHLREPYRGSFWYEKRRYDD